MTNNIENLEKIKEIIKVKIRPMLVMDGGNIEFVEYDDNNIVTVRLLGSCHGCPLSALTLKNTVETLLKEEIPEIKAVKAIEYEEDDDNESDGDYGDCDGDGE